MWDGFNGFTAPLLTMIDVGAKVILLGPIAEQFELSVVLVLTVSSQPGDGCVGKIGPIAPSFSLPQPPHGVGEML